MPIISLGIINKKILFAVISGLFKLIANTILYHSDAKMKAHPCILGINSGFGLMLAVIPHIYSILRIKKKSNSSTTPSNTSTSEYLIYNDNLSTNEQIKEQKKYYYILAIALLEFSQKFLTFFYVTLFLENFWVFDALLVLVFSFLILKTKTYAHHLISTIIIIVLGIVLIIINYYDNGITIFHIAITFLTEIFFCLEHVVCKLAMNTKNCSPYEICFYIGSFDLIIFTILLIIFSNVPFSGTEYMNVANNDYVDNFSCYIDNITPLEVIIFILSLICRCLFLLFSFLTIQSFTALHMVLVIIIGEIKFLFDDEYNWKLYLKIFFFIILVFFILIFVEILELNLFGLHKNTKKNIIERSVSEIVVSYDIHHHEIIENNENNDNNENNENNENNDSYNEANTEMQSLSSEN